ncbi:amidase [Sphaerisporangium melleum]|uniref:Amidase n=1 Tax=Sphaerisporangium melleum TaxID=321316 RepID=A0A917QZ16_9ACTN|nr:amidase family protein [Sphaerisporangium melleum]GGK76032.1 amidase [Sphaerisporangium melleum]GII72701.1 amidase [Sphaerisporangium melleum]
MELHEYARYDAVGLHDLITTGEVTVEEVEATARTALAEANAHVNGLAMPLFDAPLSHSGDGPFAGVPFLIKDAGPMAEGVPFFMGSRGLGNVPARHDTELMRRFRGAGLATLGLTAMPELGLNFATEPVRTGAVRNPWNPERGAGGSSGGAAALVAAGAVPLAHASDSGGSIRVPASCCGLVGLMPSRGRTSCGPNLGEPIFGLSYDFAVTRTVRDAARLLDALRGPGVGDKYTAPPPGRPFADEPGADPGRLRIALMTRPWSEVPVDAEVAAATTRAAHLLEEQGHHVEEARPALDWDMVIEAMVAPHIAFLAGVFRHVPRPPDPALLEGMTRRMFQETATLTVLDLMAAFDAQNRISRAVGGFFTTYDLLVTPTVARLPLPHGTLRYDTPDHTVAGWVRSVFDYGPFTAVFNITGQPAISLPLGQSADGLPIGVQIVAAYGREDLLLRVAGRFEQTAPWRARVPPLSCVRAA